MLDQAKRSAILTFKEEGLPIRAIARILKVSRIKVRQILEAGNAEVPEFGRVSRVEAHREDILAQLKGCKGNLLRVNEKLVDAGAEFSYQALTEFCRSNEIARGPRQPSREYQFNAGEEMQHDTSPHRVRIGDRVRLIQNASLTLCHSRALFHPRGQGHDAAKLRRDPGEGEPAKMLGWSGQSTGLLPRFTHTIQRRAVYGIYAFGALPKPVQPLHPGQLVV